WSVLLPGMLRMLVRFQAMTHACIAAMLPPRRPGTDIGSSGTAGVINEASVYLFLPWADHDPADRAYGLRAVHIPHLDGSACLWRGAQRPGVVLHAWHGPGPGHPDHPADRLSRHDRTR